MDVYDEVDEKVKQPEVKKPKQAEKPKQPKKPKTETTKPKQSYEILKLRKNTRSMFMVAEGIVEMT